MSAFCFRGQGQCEWQWVVVVVVVMLVLVLADVVMVLVVVVHGASPHTSEPPNDMPTARERAPPIDPDGAHRGADDPSTQPARAAKAMHREIAELVALRDPIRVKVVLGWEMSTADRVEQFGPPQRFRLWTVPLAALHEVAGLQAVLVELEEGPVDFVDDAVAVGAADAG